jgi:hypothetical protein
MSDVWEFGTAAKSAGHFAVYPDKLVENCLNSSCPNAGTVIDPFGGCFDIETEVLTNLGWKYFKDLDKSDLICSLNPENNNIEFVNFVKYIEYNYNGNMFRIKGRSIDLLVTPNHKIYAKEYHHTDFKLYTMEGFKFKNFHKLSQGINTSTLDDDKNWLKFQGFWIGDGYKVTKTKKCRGFRVGFHLKKERKIKYITEILNNLKISYNIHIEKNGMVQIQIHNEELYNKLNGKSHTKRVPEYIFNLSSKSIAFFLEGLIEADGCKSEISSCNKLLLDDVQRLFLLSNSSGSIKKHPERTNYIKGRFVNSGDQYSIYYLNSNKLLKLQSHNITEELYNDKVYDVTLKKNHVLYVRRNGKPCWSGNSGTTGIVANRLGFNATLVDINQEYCEAMAERLNG